MKHWIACMLALLTDGCVSVNSVSSETRYSGPPDPAGPCAYRWETGEVLFRSARVHNFGWEPPVAFPTGAMDAPRRGLVAHCPRRDPDGAASVSVYYLQYSDSDFDWLLAVPKIAVAGYSAGLLPLPTSRRYVVCVEATSEEGLARYAMARGEIESLQNVWGASRLNHGPVEGSERITRILEDLTSQAWHKLWLLERENLGVDDCQRHLEALA